MQECLSIGVAPGEITGNLTKQAVKAKRVPGKAWLGLFCCTAKPNNNN